MEKKITVQVTDNRFIRAYNENYRVEEIGSGIQADVIEIDATFYLRVVGSDMLVPIREFTDTNFVIVNE